MIGYRKQYEIDIGAERSRDNSVVESGRQASGSEVKILGRDRNRRVNNSQEEAEA